MDLRLKEAESLVNILVKPKFPLKTREQSLQLIQDLLETGTEPILAIIGIINHLVYTHCPEQRTRKRQRETDGSAEIGKMESISWEYFDYLWKRLLEIVGQLKSSKENWMEGSSAECVLHIYYFLKGNFVSLNREFRGSGFGNASVFAKLLSPVKDSKKNSIGLCDLKLITVVLAQLLSLDDVHLSLSECFCYLRVMGIKAVAEENFIALPNEEDGLLPVKVLPKTDIPVQEKDLWVCSKKKFVHCDRFMEVAYMIITVDGDEFRKISGLIGAYQHGVLSFLYYSGHLKMYPVAMATFGSLERLLGHDVSQAEKILLEAIHINRTSYDNAYVFPYCFLFDHLNSRQEKRKAALLPALLISDVIKQYRYLVSLDKRIHDELVYLSGAMEQIVKMKDNTMNPSVYPSIAGLIVGFIDNLCLWEEKCGSLIWHSTWSKKLISGCLHHLPAGSLQHVLLHGGMHSVNTCMKMDAEQTEDYLSAMLDALRSQPEDTAEVHATIPLNLLPADLEITEEFCQFALELYEKWPPMHLNETFIHKERMALIGDFLGDARKEYSTMVNKLREWPKCPSVSDADLLRIQPIRQINPIYKECSKHVFPFLDMGPRDIPVVCFDVERIKREVKVPLPGTDESRILYELQQHLSRFTGKNKPADSQHVYYSHVLLKSQKMLNIRNLFGHKFNQSEICLKLEGSAAGISGGAREKRDRKPSAKVCLK